MGIDRKNGKNTLDERDAISGRFEESARPIVAVDIKKYQTWIDNSDLSEEHKEEFLQALWSIVVTFVELGFGVHPLQEVCGQDSQDSPPRPKEIFNQVKSKGLDKTENYRDFSPVAGLEVE